MYINGTVSRPLGTVTKSYNVIGLSLQIVNICELFLLTSQYNLFFSQMLLYFYDSPRYHIRFTRIACPSVITLVVHFVCAV